MQSGGVAEEEGIREEREEGGEGVEGAGHIFLQVLRGGLGPESVANEVGHGGTDKDN